MKTLQEVRNKIYDLKDRKKAAAKARMQATYEPLIEAANNEKDKINREIDAEFAAESDMLFELEKQLEEKEKQLNIAKGHTLWHPHGTTVTMWEAKSSGYGSTRTITHHKTNKTGTVQVYDGTQETADNLGEWRLPKAGDVVVFFNIKNGVMGKKFEIISQYGRLRNYFNMWLAEGETYEDNLTKRIREKE